MQNVTVNLYQDWIEILRSELTSFGYDVSRLPSDKDVSHTFLNLQKRLVRPKPRLVLRAAEFFCPTELQSGLHMVEQKISSGADLLPHLSTRIRNHDYNDPMLNDWGIHHLHLGTTMRGDGFMARTGLLLFARFDESAAYLLGVLEHGVWSRQEFVHVLHRNWPNSIAMYKLNGIVSLDRTVTDQDVSDLRGANINTMVQVEPGVVYAPLGGGYSSSGLSTEVVMRSDRVCRLIERMQESLINQMERVRAEASQSNVVLPENPSFKLALDAGQAYAVETSTHFVVGLGRFDV